MLRRSCKKGQKKVLLSREQRAGAAQRGNRELRASNSLAQMRNRSTESESHRLGDLVSL